MTRVAVIGNHKHHHCSEAQWARAFEANGCDVVRMQVDNVARHPDASMSVLRTMDACTYTRTHSRGMYLNPSWNDRWAELDRAGVLTIGLHLDRYWDLEREHLVWDGDAQFGVKQLWTADGGNDTKWRAVGIDHRWLIPAIDAKVAHHEGTFDPRLACDVLFVGSGRPYHETAYPERGALLDHLHAVYGRRFRHIGPGGEPVIRDLRLNDAMRAAKVVVGDSCFANSPVDDGGHRASTAYWSDRVAETLGRSGFLIHPWVPRMCEHFTTGRHYVSHVPGDWDDLDAQIGAYIGNEGERSAIARQGREHVLANHTWNVRMREVLDACGLADTVRVS